MLSSIMSFFKNITFIDYIFFFSVIFLIILVVSLIYFIKVNEDIIKSDESLSDPDNLKEIASNIKTEKKPITFTSYEKEQEDKAIISYDELLSNTGEFELNYLDEEVKDDLTVKKVDLSNIANQSSQIVIEQKDVKLISLKKEEEFLQALKELQKTLY